MKTLVVDDERVNRKVMYYILKDFGACDLVSDGQKALDFFRESLNTGAHYDVIFLDLKMPVMDGHEALRKIKVIEKENGIPPEQGVKVVIVSALGDKDNVLETFDEGCEYFVVKPL